jgi:hypothetical protein
MSAFRPQAIACKNAIHRILDKIDFETGEIIIT